MDRGDVVSGAAFRAVLRSAVAFLAVLLLMGAYGVRLIDRTLNEEIRTHVLSLGDGLSELDAGDDGLEARIVQHLRTATGRGDAFALYGPDGALVEGSVDLKVPEGEWTLAGGLGDAGRTYLLHGARVGGYAVTIGRSTEVVALAERAAIRALALTGFVVVLAMLAIGYWLSRDSQAQLERIERALERAAEGETGARIGEGGGTGQIARISRKLDAQLARLDALMGDTRRTVASVAHDLRRPLARLVLAQERALAQAEAGRDARPEIEATLAGLGQLTGMIATILRIARIEGGTVGTLEPVDLRGVLDEVAETFAPVAEDAGGRLDYARPDAPLVIECDGEMLTQLTVNLVQNALSHAGRGATVRLATRREAGAAVIEVADDGPGIPEALRETVFAPFSRADEARTIEGSGLGLTLVKAIADRHGATVALGDAGPGLRVEVAIPEGPAGP